MDATSQFDAEKTTVLVDGLHFFGELTGTSFVVSIRFPAISNKDISTGHGRSLKCSEKTGRLWDQMDKDGKTYAVEKAIKFITLSEAENNRWAAKVKPILEEYVKAMKEKNLSGDEVLKFCKDYLAKNQK